VDRRAVVVLQLVDLAERLRACDAVRAETVSLLESRTAAFVCGPNAPSIAIWLLYPGQPATRICSCVTSLPLAPWLSVRDQV
jgi:hypothetical protein